MAKQLRSQAEDVVHRILPLLGAVSVADERGVGAQLEALEVTQLRNMEEMKL